ncbi:MAG: DNA repair protein RadC [Synergistales bacterium]|nr:DNA repair protein RadC [Synergistales bacterium]
MKISDLPISEKPREKLRKTGVENLSVVELIAVILGTGSGKLDVLELSALLLKEYRTIQNLARTTTTELSSFDGIGLAKAATLLAALELGKRSANLSETVHTKRETLQSVLEDWSRRLAFEDREYIIAFFTDHKEEVIQVETLSYGGPEGAFLDSPIFMRKAVRLGASGVGLLHNHPDGICEPSTDDLILTDFIRRQLETLGIKFLGHFLSAKGIYCKIGI